MLNDVDKDVLSIQLIYTLQNVSGFPVTFSNKVCIFPSPSVLVFGLPTSVPLLLSQESLIPHERSLTPFVTHCSSR